MSRHIVSVNNIEVEIGKVFTDYSDHMIKASRDAVNKAMKQMVRETKRRPMRGRHRKSGTQYSKSIASRITKNTDSQYAKTWYVKAPNTGLAHLLNNGHRNHYNGSFVSGDKHITTAAKSAFDVMEEMIKEAAQNA